LGEIVATSRTMYAPGGVTIATGPSKQIFNIDPA